MNFTGCAAAMEFLGGVGESISEVTKEDLAEVRPYADMVAAQIPVPDEKPFGIPIGYVINSLLTYALAMGRNKYKEIMRAKAKEKSG